MKKSDPNFYKTIGAKGGRKTAEKHGYEHFATAGKKGGEALLAERGRDFFVEIAKKSRGPVVG